MDSPIDRFVPAFDARERFETLVRAPPDLVLKTATEFDLQSLALVRGIFRVRELLLAARHVERAHRGLLADMGSLGWGVLEEAPGRHVVCGAVCQPWRADVTFTPIPAAEFLDWRAPDHVKIAWTLEADELSPGLTRFSHETRAVATDAESRSRFARYWRWARFGIVAIRLLLLPAVRRAAERAVSR